MIHKMKDVRLSKPRKLFRALTNKFGGLTALILIFSCLSTASMGQSDLIVESNYTVTGTLVVNNLTVRGGALLTIPQGTKLIVNGYVNNQGSEIVINGEVDVAGNYTNTERMIFIGSALTVGRTGVLKIGDDLTNSFMSNIENQGQIEVGGSFTNYGLWIWDGYIGGDTYSGGMLIVHEDLINNGDFQNDDTGLIIVDGTLDNNGYFQNDGIIYANPVDGIITGNQPLPVELISFEGYQKHQTVELTWTTATETNNDYFTIEKSLDAENYTVVDHIPGSGTTSARQHYTWIDQNPANGATYYRLRQTDFNGRQSYLETISVFCENIEKNLQIAVFPNPASIGDQVMVKVNGMEPNTTCLLQLIDNQGALIIRQEFHADPFGAAEPSIEIDGRFQPGFYILVALSHNEIQKAKLLIR